MKPDIPDYEWIIFGVRVSKQILPTDGCIEYWGQVNLKRCSNAHITS